MIITTYKVTYFAFFNKSGFNGNKVLVTVVETNHLYHSAEESESPRKELTFTRQKVRSDLKVLRLAQLPRVCVLVSTFYDNLCLTFQTFFALSTDRGFFFSCKLHSWSLPVTRNEKCFSQCVIYHQKFKSLGNLSEQCELSTGYKPPSPSRVLGSRRETVVQ